MEYKEFKKKYAIELNEQQDSAVCRVNGQTLLLAVPGSGKTTVITARTGYMIFCENIPPENILTVTYSVAAARDMKSRFESVFGEGINTRFRTIHGLCAMIIKAYERLNETTAFELIGKDSQVTEIIKNIYIELTNAYPAEGMLKDIKTQITYAGNMMLDEHELPQIEFGEVSFADIYKKYKEYKIKNGKMDFDDQLTFALRIIKTYPAILRSLRNRYKYINVDEAQDTSRVQHEIIRTVAGKNGNVFMVGDEDQSIYSFRAAYPKALLEFKNVYPDGEILLMETNYRSSEPIVQKADAFIKLNKDRFEKNMQSAEAGGESPALTMLADISDQYEYIAGKIQSGDDNPAVLYRNTESAIPLADILLQRSVPYYMRENDCAFFTHPIVTDIVNLLKFSLDPHDAKAFFEVYYKLGCAITKERAIRARTSEAPLAFLIEKEHDDIRHNKLIKLKQTLERAAKYESFYAIKYLLSKTGYGIYLRARYKNETKTRIMLALAKQHPNISELIARLDELQKIFRNGTEKGAGAVLSTVHASKGLEYDNVIIADAVAGIFPPNGCDMKTLEEERRIFYVAATRAKKRLEIITSAREHGSVIDGGGFVTEYFSGSRDTDKNGSHSVVAEAFGIGHAVKHRMFGSGKIQSLDGNFANIEFANGTVKKLDMVLCVQNGLITES